MEPQDEGTREQESWCVAEWSENKSDRDQQNRFYKLLRTKKNAVEVWILYNFMVCPA